MVVHNYQEFYRYIKDDQISIRFTLENCINSAAKICNCQKATKVKKMEECNRLYMDYIKTNVASLIPIFKKKTSDKFVAFNADNLHLSTINLN